MTTKIEWVRNADKSQGKTWNVVTGCSVVSEGCRNCYARRMARRLAGRCGYPAYPHHFDVTLRPNRLDIPLRRKKPTTYFVCSMSDLFHEDVPFEFIGRVFATIIAADWHTFQILTKRPERMLSFISWFQTRTALYLRMFRHIWLGVSCENQATADERIPLLLQIPAAVRFVSCEPLLEPVVLPFYNEYLYPDGFECNGPMVTTLGYSYEPDSSINWVICGGESGPGARPMHPDWARSLRDQCQKAGISYFFKQWGAWTPYEADEHEGILCRWQNSSNWEEVMRDKIRWLHVSGAEGPTWKETATMLRVGKKVAGRLLDGREWNEMPEV